MLPLLLPPREDLVEGRIRGRGCSTSVRVSRCSCVAVTAHGCTTPARAIRAVSMSARPWCIPSLRALGVDTARPHRHQSRRQRPCRRRGGGRICAFPAAPIESGEPQRLDVRCGRLPGGRQHGIWMACSCVGCPCAWQPLDEEQRSLLRHRCLGPMAACCLTGDATSRIEPAIAEALGDVRRPLVMSVPHHGSKTASSAAIPRCAVTAAGPRFGGLQEPVRSSACRRRRTLCRDGRFRC